MTVRNDVAIIANTLRARLVKLTNELSEALSEVGTLKVNANPEQLKNLNAREASLQVARTGMRRDALIAWNAAWDDLANDNNVNFGEACKHLKEATDLADQIEQVLNPSSKDKSKSKAEKAEPAETSEAKGDTDDRKVAGEKSNPVPASAPAAKSDPDKGEDKAKKGDKPAGDPILDAIKAVQTSCDKNHQDTMGAIDALKPGLITPELAAVINNLTVEQLNSVLNRRDLTPLGAELLNILGAYSPEELQTMLANLAAMSGNVERVRRTFRRNNGPVPAGSSN